MANPKSLIFQLHKHWDVIESLVRASREWPAFDEETVLRLIAKFRRASDNDPEPGETLRTLCNSDVLQWLERTNTLQVNPLVQEFVRGLLRWAYRLCLRLESKRSNRLPPKFMRA